MRIIISILFIFTIFCVMFSSCMKYEVDYDAYFWTGMDRNVTVLKLYIDDRELGVIPSSNEFPECANTKLLDKLIYVHLPMGNYKVEAIDQHGITRVSRKLKITKTGTVITSGFGDFGGMAQQGNGYCVIVELFYL